MGEKDYQNLDIVMIRPGSDAGTGPADSSGNRPSAGFRCLFRAALSVALPPLLLVGWGLRASRETGRQQENLQALDRQLGISREIGEQLQALQEREQALQAAAEAIRNLDQRRLLAAHLLETIEQSTSRTRGLWLSRVHLDPSGLLIQGQSLQAAPVGALIESLQQSPLLQRVQLSSRSQDQETGVWEFEMKALLEPNENQ